MTQAQWTCQCCSLSSSQPLKYVKPAFPLYTLRHQMTGPLKATQEVSTKQAKSSRSCSQPKTNLQAIASRGLCNQKLWLCMAAAYSAVLWQCSLNEAILGNHTGFENYFQPASMVAMSSGRRVSLWLGPPSERKMSSTLGSRSACLKVPMAVTRGFLWSGSTCRFLTDLGFQVSTLALKRLKIFSPLPHEV